MPQATNFSRSVGIFFDGGIGSDNVQDALAIERQFSQLGFNTVLIYLSDDAVMSIRRNVSQLGLDEPPVAWRWHVNHSRQIRFSTAKNFLTTTEIEVDLVLPVLKNSSYYVLATAWAEFANVPIIGPQAQTQVLFADYSLVAALLVAYQLPTVKSWVISNSDWDVHRESICSLVAQAANYPLLISDHQGQVSMVAQARGNLEPTIDALLIDYPKVVIRHDFNAATVLWVGVLGSAEHINKVQVSAVKSCDQAGNLVSAAITPSVETKIKTMARDFYQLFDLSSAAVIKFVLVNNQPKILAVDLGVSPMLLELLANATDSDLQQVLRELVRLADEHIYSTMKTHEPQ